MAVSSIFPSNFSYSSPSAFAARGQAGAKTADGTSAMQDPGLSGQAQGTSAFLTRQAEASQTEEGTKLPGQEALEAGECETCENRKYQDGSDDPGVSFKTPARIAPEMAAATVRSHEMEHVSREQFQAEQEGREVVSQTVTLHSGICPECGKVYVSGGTTRTTTRAASADTFLYTGAHNRRAPGNHLQEQA